MNVNYVVFGVRTWLLGSGEPRVESV